MLGPTKVRDLGDGSRPPQGAASRFAGGAHSALMPASRTSLPHFAPSALMKAENSAGEPVTAPRKFGSRNFVRKSSSAKIFWTSVLILPTTSGGVPLGAQRP